MTGATGRRGRPPLSEEQRSTQRLEISRHAVRLFRAQGVAATSGEQIAHAAGVSERTLWRWFRTKEMCVEPLLSQALESFQASLRSWPEGTDLAQHLRDTYRFLPELLPTDVDAVLAVVRMGREEPLVRAVWLVLHTRAEITLTEVLGTRLDLPADDVGVRIRAAAANAAFRVATEDLAHAAVDGIDPDTAERFHSRVTGSMELILHAFENGTGTD